MARSEATLLIEIGCEEIPARMIAGAADELARRVLEILDQAGLERGEPQAWGGARRLALRVERVRSRQDDREELVLGPPAEVAFLPGGEPSRAAQGFARKQGIEPSALAPVETERGLYAGFRRHVAGATVGQILARDLPDAVSGMPFPKSMRWGDGRPRWVRPLHWVLALHGDEVLPVELFGARASRSSRGHRFLSAGTVEVPGPEAYLATLEQARVLVDPAVRRERLARLLAEAALGEGGALVDDPELLDEVADLVEWPGVVAGRFDERYLELPREILVTTLRHHQKCFSIQDASGALRASFLAVANTDRDPAGHIRRGNEWVVGGRLEDARFFWREDRRTALAQRSPRLEGVVFHRAAGTYADKARRLAALAGDIARLVGLGAEREAHCRQAALLCKNDLVSGTVGEFPELQGQVGGLLLGEEGAAPGVWRAVYEHYRPAGPEDPPPTTEEGRIVSIADKLDTIARLLGAGERPTGSKDPFGLRRAGNGVARILLDAAWEASPASIAALAGDDGQTTAFLLERSAAVFRELGFTTKEILAVMRPRVDSSAAADWPLPDVLARLEAIRRVRDREDFRHLVKLTERVDNILTKNADAIAEIVARSGGAAAAEGDLDPAQATLAGMVDQYAPLMRGHSEGKCYDEIVNALSEFIEPVEEFFAACLVVDPDRPGTTRDRHRLLLDLNHLFTRYFDIRELAGEAEGRVP